MDSMNSAPNCIQSLVASSTSILDKDFSKSEQWNSRCHFQRNHVLGLDQRNLEGFSTGCSFAAQQARAKDDPNLIGEIAGHCPTLYGRVTKSLWSVRQSTPTNTAASVDGLLRTPHLACVYEHVEAAAPEGRISYDIR